MAVYAPTDLSSVEAKEWFYSDLYRSCDGQCQRFNHGDGVLKCDYR